MTIIDLYSLLSGADISLLASNVEARYSFGTFESLDDILTALNVNIVIEQGIKYHTACPALDEADKYWQKVAEKDKRALANAQKIQLERHLWSEMPLRGLYDPSKNQIELFPEEMKNEYGGARFSELLVSTLVHEIMHAYFNRPGHEKFLYNPFFEEPLAEFGMLRFLYETGNPDYNFAYSDVDSKKTCYRYGARLMDRYLREQSLVFQRTLICLTHFKFAMKGYPLLELSKNGDGVIPIPRHKKTAPSGPVILDSDKILCQFIFKVFSILETRGDITVLKAYLLPSKSPKKWALQGAGWKLPIIFHDGKSSPADTSRWFINHPFHIGGNTLYLSKEWYNNETGALKLNELEKMLSNLYPSLHIVQIGGYYILIEA